MNDAPNEAPQRRPCCDGGKPASAVPAPNGGGAGRRGFLFGVGSALMGVGGVLAALPIVGTLFAPARGGDPNRWTDLGPLSEFPEGTTRLATYRNPGSTPTDGETSQEACWVRRMGPAEFQVFAVNCAHLGCPVRWFEQSRLFMCPCHGGVYYEDGSRASGPPPRGLFTYAWRIEGDRLQILAGRLPGLQEGT